MSMISFSVRMDGLIEKAGGTCLYVCMYQYLVPKALYEGKKESLVHTVCVYEISGLL